MQRSIVLLEAKCKSVKAIYQIRPKSIRPVQGSGPHSIRFSGTPDTDLNHILEVLSVGSRIVVMVYSDALRCAEDMDGLAEEIAEVNKKLNHGAWVFDLNPGVKQFCFMMWMDCSQSLSDEQLTQLLWKTVLAADSAYKPQARRLMSFIFKKLPISKTTNVLSAPLARVALARIEELYGKVEAEALEDCMTFRFEGRFKDSKLGEKFDVFLCEVTFTRELCKSNFYFCQNSRPATFASHHRIPALLDRLNKFNLILGVGQFLFTQQHVVFRHAFYWRDFNSTHLSLSLRSILTSLPATLPKYFEYVQKYYLNPIKSAKPCDDTSVSERKFTREEEFAGEEKELARLEQSSAGKHLLKSAYRLYPASLSVKYFVPRGCLPLSEVIGTGTLLPENAVVELKEMLCDLRISRAFYSHIADIIYITSEEHKFVIIPMRLTDSKSTASCLTNLLTKLSVRMLESEQFFAKSCELGSLTNLLQPCDQINYGDIRVDPKTQQHMLGLDPVDIIPLDGIYTYRELHQVLFQMQRYQKGCRINQAVVYGITITNKALFVVAESLAGLPLLQDLRLGDLSTTDTAHLYEGIHATAEHCLKTGIALGNIDAVRVRNSGGRLYPVFPAPSFSQSEDVPAFKHAKLATFIEKQDAVQEHVHALLQKVKELSEDFLSTISI